MRIIWLVFGVCFAWCGTLAQQTPVGRFSVAITSGYVWSDASEAIMDFKETRFNGSMSVGGSVLYHFAFGQENTEFHAGIAMYDIRMGVDEEGSDIGTLRMMNVLIILGGGKMEYGRGGGYGIGEIGVGKCLSRFEKGAFVTSLERSSGVRIDVNTKEPLVVTLGGEVGYFLMDVLSPFLGFQVMIGDVNSTWDVSGGSVTVPLPNIGMFQTLNSQIHIGVRCWLL